MFRLLSILILRLAGWKISGTHPNETPKKLLVVAPHTSSMDFLLGLLVRASWRMDSNYLIKDDFFKGPFKWFFKATGGHPVDRSGNTRLVDQIVEIFNQHDRFAIAITPEGTRKRVKSFKSGFYHIARNADIPVVLVKMDFGNRHIHFSDPQKLGANQAEEMKRIEAYFSGIEGKKKEYSFYQEIEPNS